MEYIPLLQHHITFDETGRSGYPMCLNDLNDAEGKEIYAEALDGIMMQAYLNSALHV